MTRRMTRSQWNAPFFNLRGSSRQKHAGLIAGLALLMLPACAPADTRGASAAAPPPQVAPAASASSTTNLLADLAAHGRFDDVLATLRANPEAQANGLVANLERYAANNQRRATQRNQEYGDALARVQREAAADHLPKALAAAIAAHSIASDPAAFLDRPEVRGVVQRADVAAHEAEVQKDWVEAGFLFGRLNLLYEHEKRYHDDVKRVNSRLRLLALYAPDAFKALKQAREERAGNGEDALNRHRPDAESWENRLRGINKEMLHVALRTTADQHIDRKGYASLLSGAVQPLLTLIDTPALAQTFPGLNDPDKVEAFRKTLLAAKADFEDPQRAFTEFRSLARLDGLMAENHRTVNLPESVMAFEMTEGALGTLDQFSSMYWPQDVSFLARSTQGAFTGVGIQISRKDDQLTVISPLNGTPAQKAGIKAGDVIATVNDMDTAAWSLNKAVREITGPQGTEVKLGVRRPGDEGKKTYLIRRDRIEIESVKGWVHTPEGEWDYWLDRSAGIGYVRLTQFIPQSLDKVDEAVAALQKEGPLNGLILDLRHNPGGLLTSAIRIVDRFVEKGPILFTVNSNRDVQNAWNARRRGTYPADLNVVVLINRGSASASEIVSGALQDRERAIIVGDRSYGKGSVQDVKWFPSRREIEWGLKVTTQYYQLPNGRIIHRTPDATQWGVNPDLVVDVTDQTVAWGLELRQEIDVLREAGQETFATAKTRPWVRLAGLEPVDSEAPDAKETVEVPVPGPEAILDMGLDPQLEAALLVLKTTHFSGE
ncbi:MAG: S41 family peptidase [Algisphaera sp.]